MQITSAYAGKMLKKLQENKEFLLAKERRNSTYIVANNEEAVVPDFDFVENTKEINQLNEQIVALKHALNIQNATSTIRIQDKLITIDMALVMLAQLNSRKKSLDTMRQRQPKCRVDNSYNSKNVSEYQYANYNIADAQEEYERVDALIAAIQLELDKYNQTVLFDVDID